LYQQRPHEKFNGSACLQHHTLQKNICDWSRPFDKHKAGNAFEWKEN